MRMLKPRVRTLDTRIAKPIAGLNGEVWRRGKTTTQRGYGGWWQKARVAFLSRRPLCCYCQRDGRIVAATVVDHIVPHKGNEALLRDESNWQPLCKPCHDAKTQREDREITKPGSVR